MTTTALSLSLILTLIFLLMALSPLLMSPSSSNDSASLLVEKKFFIITVVSMAKNSLDRTTISLSSDSTSLMIASHTDKHLRARCIDLLA